ncbi:glycosyltransferase family 2 protein [Kitasatospora sp. NPDC089913]|uniref:glycosyltransferase family 2 protein n=1 Tax=Kitasatospora sp. NPDC089913 TaxID=3364080 RepID=UPI0038283997
MTFSVTVVVPAHNAARTLSACLDSVYAQIHRPHQVIVVDDGSTDATARIAEAYAVDGGPAGGSGGGPAGGPPCELIRQWPNRGVSAARNAGISAATGEVIFFLDSDEALTPDSVANALEILEKDPECGCVHGVIAPEPLFDDGPVERYRVLHAHWWRVRGAGVVETAFFAQAAVRREVFERIGGFDESLRDSEDLELSDRLAPHYRIVLTDRIVAHHDEVERLGPLLAETYRRALVLVPALASARRGGRRNLTANSPASVVSAAFTLAALPLAGRWPVLPVAGLAAFCAANAGLLRFAARRHGAAFAPYAAGVHFLVVGSLLAGAGVGALRMLRPGRRAVPGAAPGAAAVAPTRRTAPPVTGEPAPVTGERN